MQKNNNLSVLPFYRNIEEQTHRRSYSYGDIYPLYTPSGTVLPFQIIHTNALATVSSAVLYKPNGTSVGNILSYLQYGGLTSKVFSDYGFRIHIYPSSIASASLTPDEGQYYIVVTMSDGVAFYSDVFTVVKDVQPYLKLEWWDREDLLMNAEAIAYDLGSGSYFKNRLYLCTQLGKPEYEFKEEGEERDGLFFPEKMLSEKTYKFTFLAPEYLCDVMRFIRMSDIIDITDMYGNTYRCDQFLMTPKWETQGNVASVECEFQCNTVAKRIGRAFI